MQPWVRAELASADLGDARRQERFRKLVDQLSRTPQGTFNEACPTPADKKAAYRFFASDHVYPDRLRKPHVDSTRRRMASHQRVLVVQDTTSLGYTSHRKTQGLGPLDNADGHGFFVHSALAVTQEGEPLGLVHQQVWVRDEQETGKSERRRERPWQEKESFKWQRTVQSVSQGRAAARKPKQLIIIGDRESDVYGLLASPRPSGVELLVRSAQNRRTQGEDLCLHDALSKQPVAGRVVVEVARTKDRQPRRAICEVRYGRFTLQAPAQADPGVPKVAVKIWAVGVQEGHAPKGEAAARWVLLATWPVESFAEATRCAKLYSRRWLVERYHFVLKSGCRVEEAQLRERIRLERLQAVYAIVAWHLLAITYHARRSPGSSCEPHFTALEWQVMYAYHHGEGYPEGKEAPTIEEAVLWVGKLGGFWGRRRDGPPGVKVLWRGLTKLYALVDGFTLSSIISRGARCG